MELFKQTIHALHERLSKKEISAVELAKAVFARTDAVEPKIRSYITETREQAMAQAAAVDAKIARGEAVAPLAGIPGALKDNICTKGIKTTCASKILANFVPPYDATVVDKLAAQAAVLTGKANCDEFAMGGSTENSGFFVTHNPWDTDRVPGGSSGGSASAVAAGQAIWALGSDTGGSIRQPAAYCGNVGLKPTYGRVSRYGLVAYASSLDQIGPITRDVTDSALVLNAIAGHDGKDSTSINAAVPDYTKALVKDVKGLKIGLPQEYFGTGIQPEVAAAIKKAVAQLTAMGAEVREVSLPHTEYALPAYYLIAPAEASSNLARYDGVGFGHRAPGSDIVEMYKKSRSEGFGPEVKRRVMLGTYALSSGYYDAYYLKALQVRTLVKQDFDKAFAAVDVLITPTAPTTAFKIGELSDPLAMYLQDVCTIPINLAGLPGISLPCGFADGMPIGMQIIGKPLAEATIIQAAYAFEQANDYHTRFAPLGEG
ncbi:Asp-tRNA(Asn)/Glu-tRNA(Gln) amidotransferase subunit GatA [Sporomusa acidovorans]|uniref:Glutamyl-tRNA(Gln) amidotransferase subunit A n=1 Tax=Sporomusa acidovorans (strain ATCC 49682 / DSM 3132 / Mol) TaxID=1123286 RepID=A0ABZ3J181_SPOA4|nr:Asp-tRNA(Asn)/Glu-tRNA(Gln) amidotransferase subunit GatA [Sporomusa acidovorans]OZC13640.1 glutamyl-tRNA(Gln) amidotransferase subunit A [Sporomusa acidovorans DSM 3132]SDE86265.1 aspartyl/glutamyl-tRNA(Asn/Gln) amidotransferase subunit A [Sporomusa acidovorans]